MHLHHAIMGLEMLRQRRSHPLADPLEGSEWACLWRLFVWRYTLARWLRRISPGQHNTGDLSAQRKTETAS